ncbi:MAG: biotin/lipoate A/B protein ligase family protein [Candidatus Bathyarchaeia archaeon]
MENQFRIIGLSINDAYMNMAIDEAILKLCSIKKSPNTLRLYRWNPSAVSIGYFQSIEDEVNIEACKIMGIDVVRRITGGGAVYHDFEGEITYSLIVKEDNPKIPFDIIKSYETICKGIILGLKELGLNPEFKPINDIVINNKKISGNAQTRKSGVVLQHGTILLDSNIQTMFKVLKVRDKMITAVEERVTTIKKELGRKPSFEEVEEALKHGFEDALQVNFFEGSLTPEELKLAKELKENKYSTKEWIFKR